MAHSDQGYPVVLVLAGKRCLVVGGGSTATRKVIGLLDSGAKVTVIAPRIDPPIGNLPVEIEERCYRKGEAGDYHLVFAATGIEAVDGAVFSDALAAGVFVNAADDPAHCSFYLPALGRVGSISIALSTDGTSPALASYLRDKLMSELPEGLEQVLEAVSSARRAVKEASISTEQLDWRALIDQLFELLAVTPDGSLEQITSAFVADAVARAARH